MKNKKKSLDEPFSQKISKLRPKAKIATVAMLVSVENQLEKHRPKEVLASHKTAPPEQLGEKVKDLLVTMPEILSWHLHHDFSRDNSVGARFSRKEAPTGRGAKSPSARSGIRVSTDNTKLYFAVDNFKPDGSCMSDTICRLTNGSITLSDN